MLSICFCLTRYNHDKIFWFTNFVTFRCNCISTA